MKEFELKEDIRLLLVKAKIFPDGVVPAYQELERANNSEAMNRVEVFRTNVLTRPSSQKITACLGSLYEGAQVSFDLEDIDRILRIASSQEVDADLVAGVVSSFGFHSEVLPDEVVIDGYPVSHPGVTHSTSSSDKS